MRAPSWRSATSAGRWSAALASKPPILSASSRLAVLDRDDKKGLVPVRLAHPPPMGDGRNSMTRRALSLVIAALLLHAPVSWAVQLDKESCTKLKSEQAQLEKDGARGSLGKGPDWAKANLGAEKLDQVRRLIEVDEQLLFRCGGRRLVVLPSDPDAARAEGAHEKPEKSQHDVGKKAAVPVKRATPSLPGKETARETRPAAPPPRGNAPAAGAAREVAKEPPPAGATAAPDTPTPPPPPPTKEDPAHLKPGA